MIKIIFTLLLICSLVPVTVIADTNEELSDADVMELIDKTVADKILDFQNLYFNSNREFQYRPYIERVDMEETYFLAGHFYQDTFVKEVVSEKESYKQITRFLPFSDHMDEGVLSKLADIQILKDHEFKIRTDTKVKYYYNLKLDHPVIVSKNEVNGFREYYTSYKNPNAYYQVLTILNKLHITQQYQLIDDILNENQVIVYQISNTGPEILKKNKFFTLTQDLKFYFQAKLNLDNLDYESAEKNASKALESAQSIVTRSLASALYAESLYKQGKYQACHQSLISGLKNGIICDELLYVLGVNLIRLNRTRLATSIFEKVLEINPYHERAHYYLGNGYAKYNYTQLQDKYHYYFAGTRHDRRVFTEAKEVYARGDKELAVQKVELTYKYSPFWVEPKIFLASIYWENENYDEAEKYVFKVLDLIPEHGRAHAIMARIQESRRLKRSVLAHEFEIEFENTAYPEVEGIEKYVINWSSLSPHHQKRVALSVEPWKNFIPVLNEVGATHYIKPLHEKLSECPQLESLSDARIGLDSRLWDDVRGCGGFNTVTGIEDVNRNIYGGYNTVIHELTHQVHGVLTNEQKNEIEDVYRNAKAKETKGQKTFMSRYQGLTVWEYFAEGVNAYYTPGREFDGKEIKYPRLLQRDQDLHSLVEKYLTITDVKESLIVGKVNKAYQYLETGNADSSFMALESLDVESSMNLEVLQAKAYISSILDNDLEALAFATVSYDTAQIGMERNNEIAHAANNYSKASVWLTQANCYFHMEDGVKDAIKLLKESFKYEVEPALDIHLSLARYFWIIGDYDASVSECDNALKIDSKSPYALWAKANSLGDKAIFSAPQNKNELLNESFSLFEKAITLRSGKVDLRLDYARILILAGEYEKAEIQINEVLNLKPDNKIAISYSDWIFMNQGGSWVETKTYRFEKKNCLPDFSKLLFYVHQNSFADEIFKSEPEYVFYPEEYSYQTVKVFPAWMQYWINMKK